MDEEKCKTLSEIYRECMNLNDYTSFKKCEFVFILMDKNKCSDSFLTK